MSEKSMLHKVARVLKDPGAFLILVTFSVAFFLLFFAGLESVRAGGDQPAGKTLRMDEVRQGELLVPAAGKGEFTAMPRLAQNVKISVSGIVARVVVRQKFINPGTHWIEAIYVFPLPSDCAVDHLQIKTGDRVIVGEIKEKQKARAIYEQAKRQGRKASLLSQQRPNIFTSSVANIGPGETVTVQIEYQQVVSFSDHIFSLRFPMVVGPRYIPGSPMENQAATLTFNGGGWAADTDQVPDASKITPPVVRPGAPAVNPVRLSVDLVAGFPLAKVDSLYHGVKINKVASGHYTIHLTGEVKADRDFVLEWQPKNKDKVAAALFSEDRGNDRYLLLMLLPPADSKTVAAVAREMIFVLDISGSMAGPSIRQAKKALDMALSRLRPEDRFNIIAFNDRAYPLFTSPRPADAAAVATGLDFVDGLKAGGGTEMAPALSLALDGRDDHDRVRQVVFLTDGCVGNESSLFTLIRRRLGDSRLFTVGIGSAPNSYFMTRAASMGRGTFTYIGKIDEVGNRMKALFTKLEHPVLSDLKVSRPDGSGSALQVFPDPLPDLYDQEPLIVSIKTDKKLTHLLLQGMRAGQPWQVVVNTTRFAGRPGIATLWARKKIRSEMESLHFGADRKEVRKTVLATALAFHLVSPYTSLVAVDQQISRPAGRDLAVRHMKTNLPAGWQYNKVFGGGAKTGTPSELWIILGGVLLIFALLLVKERKEP